MATALTKILGRFLSEASFTRFPAKAVETAKTGFSDCLAVMLAGRNEPVARAAEEVFGDGSAKGHASVFLGSRRMSSAAAAAINGTAAHALDYDDVALKGSHPSAVLVPAIVAEGEALNAPGVELLTAYIAGYEVWADLISRESGNYQKKGWHPTGIFGAIAAAAACAVLHRLNPSQAACALGIAASQSSGIMANLGSMAKPTHTGRAAAAGIIAGRLAKAGVTAAEDALEHPQGFLNAVSPSGTPDLERVPAVGKIWAIESEGLSVKQYPVCYRAHRPIDGMFELLEAAGFAANEVERLGVRMSRSHTVILKNHRPRDGIAAKFSVEFALACAICTRRVGLRELVDKVVLRPDIQRLIPLVDVEIDESEEPGTSGYALHDSVRVRLASGKILESSPIRFALGDSRHPLGLEQMWKKFEDCITWSGLDLNARRLFDTIHSLEQLASARDLRKTAASKRRRIHARSEEHNLTAS